MSDPNELAIAVIRSFTHAQSLRTNEVLRMRNKILKDVPPSIKSNGFSTAIVFIPSLSLILVFVSDHDLIATF